MDRNKNSANISGSKEERFRTLANEWRAFDPGEHEYSLKQINPEQKKALVEQIDVLEKLNKHLESRSVNAEYGVFSFAIPAIMQAEWYAAPKGTSPEQAGVSAVLKFAHKMMTGQNTWAAAIASVSRPAPFFRRLTEHFDANQEFAQWTTKPTEAAHDLKIATRGDAKWSEKDLAQWQEILSRVGGWLDATKYDARKFALAKDGYALGVEVERRNLETPFFTKNTKKPVDLETVTPHTTNLNGVADYLNNIKKYFVDTDGMFPPNHFWNLHLNLSLSKEAHNTCSSEKYYGAVDKKARPIICDLVQTLLFPANPYARNVYVMHSNARNTFVKAVTPFPKHFTDDDGLIGDDRCLARKDYGRLEMKCVCAWAGMDVDYIMGCMKIMHLLSEHPEHIEAFKQELNDCYADLMKPEKFKNVKFVETNPECISDAHQYEKASKRFRTEMKARFPQIIAKLESPAHASFQQRLASQATEPRSRG